MHWKTQCWPFLLSTEQKFLVRQQFSQGLASFFHGLAMDHNTEKLGLPMRKFLSCLDFLFMDDQGPNSLGSNHRILNLVMKNNEVYIQFCKQGHQKSFMAVVLKK